MNTSSFWDNVLEPDENLLWAGRPKPRLHWRNWKLYSPAPLAAAGLLTAAWFIINTSGSEGDMWLLILPALMIFIPARATWQQLKFYATSRYALTDKRVLFFQISGEETRVRAYPNSALIPPTTIPTTPASVKFLRHDTGKAREFGFDFIDNVDDLLSQLEQPAQ